MKPQPEQHASIPCAACQFPTPSGSPACPECGLPIDVTQRLHKRFGLDLSLADKALLLKSLRLTAAGLLTLAGTAAGSALFLASVPKPTTVLVYIVGSAFFLGVAASFVQLGWVASRFGARFPLALSGLLLLCIPAHLLLGNLALPVSFFCVFWMLLPLLIASLTVATRNRFRLDGAMNEHGMGTTAATGWIVIAAELVLGACFGFDSKALTAVCVLVAAVAILLALMDALHTLGYAKRAIATKR